MSTDARQVYEGLQGRTIGILSSLVAGPYFGGLISAVAAAVARAGGHAVALQTQRGDWRDRHHHGPARAWPVAWEAADGFVALMDSADPDLLARVRSAGRPVVNLSHPDPSFACPMVVPDNAGGARKVVEHLVVEHGHRRVAFVGDLSLFDVRERFAGYRAALADHGIDPGPALVYVAPNNGEHGGRIAARAMLEAGLPSTALVAATDGNALGALGELMAAGLCLPRDQAVAGFDNTPGAALSYPALTTVSLDYDLMAARAVELLALYLSGGTVAEDSFAVGAALLVRESCGCAGSADDVGVELDDGDAVGSFVRALQAPAPEGTGPHAPEGPARLVAGTTPAQRGRAPGELARAIAAGFTRAVEAEPSPLELLELGQLAARLHGPGGEAGSLRAMALATRLARRLEQGASPEARRRLDRCLQHVAAGISRAGALEQVRVNKLFREQVGNEHEITMQLLSTDQHGPRSLEWLELTGAGAGALALWAPGRVGAELEVVGTYDRSGELDHLVGRRYEAAAFPPPGLLSLGALRDATPVTLLLPVMTATSDWGYLALVVPAELTLTGAETYSQWSALISQALDFDSAVRSVQQRKRELAESDQRERDMARSIRQSEERYALAARAANDGLWDWDLTTGTVYYSDRWKAMFGYKAAAIGDSPQEWFGRAHPDDRPALMRAIGRRTGDATASFELEHRMRTADGSYRWALCRGLVVLGAEGRPTRVVGSLTDVTARRSLEDQLLRQALFDALTGLPNRTLFLDRLSQSIAYARREPGYDYAVLWLDLDGFKLVNDSLGHLVGDQLLCRVADRLRASLRETDTAARFGGDEFAVLLHDIASLDVVDAVVERLQAELRQPYVLGTHEVVVTASIGITGGASSYEKAEDVLRDADIAMYRAKSAGRAGHMKFDASMHAGAVSRLQTESALRQAVERGALELHYQPIVDLATGAVRGMEALVRWPRSDRAPLPPSEFLPVAEESGLVVPMGRWVQMEACRQMAEWKAAGLLPPQLRMNLNLSHREFWAPGLLGQLDEVLSATGVPANWVCLEITEDVFMHKRNLGRALEILDELHNRGLQIHIDDFGTGYSSLEALHRLPIDALKVDRSFVANLPDDKSAELLRTIVQLGRNLGVDVVAEGIETAGQQRLLAQLGCPFGQGYWFCVPLPAADLRRLLAGTRALPAPLASRRPADLAAGTDLLVGAPVPGRA